MLCTEKNWNSEVAIIEKQKDGVLYYPAACISGYNFYYAEPHRGDSDHVDNGIGFGSDARTKVSLDADYKVVRLSECSEESIKFLEEHFEPILRIAVAESAEFAKNEDGSTDKDTIIFTYTSLYVFDEEEEKHITMKVFFKIRQNKSNISDIRILQSEVEDLFRPEWRRRKKWDEMMSQKRNN